MNMEPEVYTGLYYKIEDEHGQETFVPEYVVGPVSFLAEDREEVKAMFDLYTEQGCMECVHFDEVRGTLGRHTMPGCMDSTPWTEYPDADAAYACLDSEDEELAEDTDAGADYLAGPGLAHVNY